MCKQQPLALPSHQTLAQLASDDPPAFEALCGTLIENQITHAPERLQLRLRQLQFRVDGIRRLSGSPLDSLLKIQALMWDSFLQMNEEWENVARQSQGGAHQPSQKMPVRAAPRRSARIIEFQAREPRKTG